MIAAMSSNSFSVAPSSFLSGPSSSTELLLKVNILARLPVRKKKIKTLLLSKKNMFHVFCLIFFINSLRAGPHHKRCRTRVSPPVRRFATSLGEVCRGSGTYQCSTTPDPLASFRYSRPQALMVRPYSTSPLS